MHSAVIRSRQSLVLVHLVTTRATDVDKESSVHWTGSDMLYFDFISPSLHLPDSLLSTATQGEEASRELPARQTHGFLTASGAEVADDEQQQQHRKSHADTTQAHPSWKTDNRNDGVGR